MGLLVSALALVAQGLGSVIANAVLLVAVLISLVFIIGVDAAWTEVGRMSKGVTKVLHANDIGFGPWDVVVSDDGLEAKTRGYGFWLRFADLQDVSVDDAFVVLRVHPAWEFPIPLRCLGGDAPAQALKRFVEAKRPNSPTQP